MLGDQTITDLQETYIKKAIDALNSFDNLFWEVGNEIEVEVKIPEIK